MHAQLVALAGDRLELVARQIAVYLQHLHVRDGVGHTGHFVLQHEVARLLNAAAAGDGPAQPGPPGCNGLVGFSHLVLTEQRAIGGAAGLLLGKQHQPGGVTIDAVNRHQVIQTQLALEPHQHRFCEVAARGHDGQEVRLVDHQQVIVLVQHHLIKRNGNLVGHLAVVVETLVRGVGRVAGLRWRNSLAKLVDDVAACHARQPDLGRHIGKARGQKVQQAGPGAGGQTHAARTDPVARGRPKCVQTPGPTRHGPI